jgi:uncharacterized membrane protein YfcA
VTRVALLSDPSLFVWLVAAFGFAAALYSSVGHGGASAYLALMALFAVTPEAMRPTALVLNICVAGIGAVRYIRSGNFDWPIFWPFAVTAIPVAFFAGRIPVPEDIYKPILGAALLLAAARYLFLPNLDAVKAIARPGLAVALPSGAALGGLAGVTGTGGGIFLSPFLVFMGWADAKKAAGVAALFIVANSAAGLAGRLTSLQKLPNELPILIGAVVTGALIGTTLNLRAFSKTMLLRALGLVLLVAGAALLFDL